ncbi:EAL domain-containing protein [Actinokineospora bangkokensis]|uniref:GGDEF domain-containing protein n=1 Tax=Actinokineospora bangkokensis TaxID=1193682 RepID=A0A1Q9LSN5_9PSEU|nr:EAL domain-containing protein [Actinokineospora bangkokensis]OLR95028.1 hypothetical protein BJP25_08705 [Actinokineospora bangkokensis]
MTSPPRAELAAGWATALAAAQDVPGGRADELTAALDDLRARARAAEPATAAGAALVAAGYGTAECLRVTVDLLGPALLDEAGPGAFSALAGFTAGFAEAVRDAVVAEQAEVRSTLVRARHEAELARDAGLAHFDGLFSAAPLGMVISTPDRRVVLANDALSDMLEHPRGTIAGDLLDLVHPEEREHLRTRYAELASGEFDRVDERHTRLVTGEGEPVWVRLTATAVHPADGGPARHVTAVENVTDLHLLERKISFEGTHDPLTGLLNRSAFATRLQEALETGADKAVLHLVLDDFAVINSGIGPAAGERLLADVAARLEQLLADLDAVLARTGTEEFAVLLPRAEAGGELVERINDALAEPTWLDGHGVAASASVAVVLRPAPGTAAADLLAATAIALRDLRATGKRQWCLVDAEEDRGRRARSRLAAGMPGAWETGALSLAYEPVWQVPGPDLRRARVLLRWDHPTEGVLDDARCRALLADTGLAVPLARWALHHAADQLAGHVPPYLELTAEQASDPDLVGPVRAALAAAEGLSLGFPVEALCDYDMPAEDNLRVLTDLGVRTVLTGFGRTRGDLACLEDLHFDAVSLDPTVVARVAAAPEGSLFPRAVRDLVALVREAGYAVVVGGVADQAQLDWWVAVGANRACGPLLGTSVPGSELPGRD